MEISRAYQCHLPSNHKMLLVQISAIVQPKTLLDYTTQSCFLDLCLNEFENSLKDYTCQDSVYNKMVDWADFLQWKSAGHILDSHHTHPSHQKHCSGKLLCNP
mmetsp:Transcript_10075/g.13197  ORF Transcript_10075/g.13197 Transcript_10075/m.13197 type:complete len:103 (+) Transcript_10075:102-410(+)